MKKEENRRSAILLLFLSAPLKEQKNKEIFSEEKKGSSSTIDYTVDGSSQCFKGIRTNDAPVKYLIWKAIENGDLIQKILYIITEEVKDAKNHKEFEQMIESYIRNDERIKEYYQDCEIKYEEIEYPKYGVKNQKNTYADFESETSRRAGQIYAQIVKKSALEMEMEKNVYIDYTGGFRDISFLMTVIIRYLEYHGASCKEIVYSHKDNRKIYSLFCIYKMFQLLNGVQQFVSTGNAELLEEFYKEEEDGDTRELLNQIVEFSHVMSLCDVEKVDQIMENLQQGLDQYEEKKKRESFFTEIFSDMISIIRQKLNIEKNHRYTYPKLIQWCLDNSMVQQALTLYVEKMPQYYYESGFLNLPMKERKMKPGATEAGTAFYVELYDSIGGSKELRQFAERLKCGYKAMTERYGSMESLEASRFRGLALSMKTDQEKRAVQKIVNFLRTKYEGGEFIIFAPYTKEPLKQRPRTMNGFVKMLLNDKHWQHYFLYNDKKRHEELQMGTYEKKVNALDKLRIYQGNIPESNISNEELYFIMKYYLLLKMLRNRINHASEEGAEEDEKNALERLKKGHGLCTEREFKSVKERIFEGVQSFLKDEVLYDR